MFYILDKSFFAQLLLCSYKVGVNQNNISFGNNGTGRGRDYHSNDSVLICGTCGLHYYCDTDISI